MIPRRMHQIWIGPRPRPSALMNEWQAKHPDWEYFLWSDFSLGTLDPSLSALMAKIDELPGKTDILRYHILHAHGGVYIDADTRLVAPLDERFLEPKCWA